MNIDPIRAAIAPYTLLIKVGGVLLALGLVTAFIYHKGGQHWRDKFDTESAAHKADNASHKAVITNLAALTKAADAKAKVASVAAKAARKTNDKRFEDAQHEADQAKRDLRAALRNGTVRLREEWACPATRPAEGDASGIASGQDASAQLRQTGAASLIAAADHADNWIGWLQAELTSTRQACGVAP